MCTDLKVTYRCGHFQSHRAQCATYKKQQSSLKNILFGRYSGRNDCGKVWYSYQECGGECTPCVVALEGFRTEIVGHGAAMLHRQIVDETFRQKEQTQVKGPSRRSEKSPRSSARRLKRDVISGSNSVWAADMYYKKTPVQQVSYPRGYAPAPPVAPPRPPHTSRLHESSKQQQSPRPSDRRDMKRKPRDREVHTTKGWEYRDPKIVPRTYDASPPRSHKKPAEPKPVWKPTSRPPVVQSANWPLPSHRLETPPAQARSAYPSVTSHGSQPTKVRPVPPSTYAPAYYEVYLNAYHSMPQRELRLSPERITQVATAPKKKGHAKKSSLQAFASAICFEDESDKESDLSFVCARAREEERRCAPALQSQRRPLKR